MFPWCSVLYIFRYVAAKIINFSFCTVFPATDQFFNRTTNKQCKMFGPMTCGDPEKGDWGPDPPPPEKSENTGFLSNSSPDPLNSYEATETAFNVVQSSVRHRNAI